MNDLLWWIAQNALFVAVFTPAVWLAARLRRSRPAEQHLLWLLLLVKLMTPPVVVWPWEVGIGGDGGSREREIVGRGEGASGGGGGELVASPIGGDVSRRHDALLEHASGRYIAPSDHEALSSPDVAVLVDETRTDFRTEEATAVASNTSVPRSPASPDPPPPGSPFPWTPLLVSIWFAGAVVVCGRTVLHVVGQRRLLRSSHDAPVGLQRLVDSTARLRTGQVGLRVSDHVGSPFVSCLWRPTLVWPASLCDDASLTACEGVVAHELSHIRRRDHWVTRLEAVAAPLWWWNPIFWYVRRRLDETRELACDALALELTATDRRSFAELLLSFSAGPKHVAFAPLRTGIAPRHPLRRRLAMLFDTSVNGRVSRRGMLLPALLAVAVLPGWAWSQEEPEPAAEDDTPPAAAPAPEAPSTAPVATAEPIAPTPTISDGTPQPAAARASAPTADPAAASAGTFEAKPAQAPVTSPEVVAKLGDGRTLHLRSSNDGKTIVAEVRDGERVVQSLVIDQANVPQGDAAFLRPAPKAAIFEGPKPTQLLVFKASWLPPSLNIEHLIANLLAEGRSFGVIDVDRNRDTAKRYEVTAMPTIIAIKDGREVGRLVGEQTDQALRVLAAKLDEPADAPPAGDSHRTVQPQPATFESGNDVPPPVATANSFRRQNVSRDTELKLLENALELAELDVEEKKLLLENGRYANDQNPGSVPTQELRLLEFSVRRAELQAEQARIRLDAAKRTEPVKTNR